MDLPTFRSGNLAGMVSCRACAVRGLAAYASAARPEAFFMVLVLSADEGKTHYLYVHIKLCMYIYIYIHGADIYIYM